MSLCPLPKEKFKAKCLCKDKIEAHDINLLDLNLKDINIFTERYKIIF